MRDSFRNIFRFRFVINLAFLLFGCEQVSIVLSGDSEVFVIEADSDSKSASFFFCLLNLVDVSVQGFSLPSLSLSDQAFLSQPWQRCDLGYL